MTTPRLRKPGRHLSGGLTPPVPVGDGVDCERLFVAELGTVKEAIDFIVRRHRLNADEAEEFRSEVYLKLVDDEYAVIRKFEGRSSLRTYLTVVINRLYLDSRVKEWGKWRPSAIAKRGGPAAILFERLLCRQGLSFEEACSVLESAHHVSVNRPALEPHAGVLPSRSRRRYVSAEALEQLPSTAGDPSSGVLAAAHAAAVARTSRALAAEIAALSPPDRLLLRRRFLENARLLEVAQERSEPPKVIYRRLAWLLMTLRRRLETRGISRFEDVDVVLAARAEPRDAHAG